MDTHLVTGGAGFIGSNVVRAMLAEPALERCKIVILDDLSGGFRENLPIDPRVIFVEGSITDSHLINRLFSRFRFRWIYHFAAYAAEGLSHFIRRFNYTNNLIGSINLINAAVIHCSDCFVFTSSIAVYGSEQLPFREDTFPQPQDPYGIAKLAVEQDLQAAHRIFGLPYVIFRPHNVYGEYQNIGDPYRNVVGIFMNQILQGKPLTIFGDGEQKRAFTYVGDIAPIIARAPLVESARNRVFNIGADHPCTVNKLAFLVARTMGVDLKKVHLPAREEVQMAYADHSSSRNVFGCPSETPLEEGLLRMASWVKKVGSRSSVEFKNIEISRNLPLAWKRNRQMAETLKESRARSVKYT